MNKNWLVFCIFLGMMILTACASSGAQQGGDLTGKVSVSYTHLTLPTTILV